MKILIIIPERLRMFERRYNNFIEFYLELFKTALNECHFSSRIPEHRVFIFRRPFKQRMMYKNVFSPSYGDNTD